MSYTLHIDTRDPREAARRSSAAIPAGGVFYYALGGGLGHLARAMAIARRWRQVRTEPFVIFSSSAVQVDAGTAHLRLTERRPEPVRLGRLVLELAESLRPSVFAADAFPAGILGELPPVLARLACPRLAVLRRLQARWAEEWELPALLASSYTRRLAIESPIGFEVEAVEEVAPVLLCDPGEVLSRPRARAALGHSGDEPLVLAVTTGTQPRDQGLQGLCVKIACRLGAAIRIATPYPPGPLPARYVTHFPLMEWLPGADLVIGPCGYNLFHEAGAVGARAVWVPQPRHYDDQFARAEGSPVARSPEELEVLARAALGPEWPGPAAPPPANGAGAVASALAELAER